MSFPLEPRRQSPQGDCAAARFLVGGKHRRHAGSLVDGAAQRPTSDDGKPAAAASGEHVTARRNRAKEAERVSDNVFADSPGPPPVFRARP
jgi:hypothetical protein